MMKPHKRSGKAFSGMTIGLLGGSFNPAHDGHLEMSLFALKQMKLDMVWWLVSPQNPLKTPVDTADLKDRVESARRLARHPRFVVTDIEREFGTRYTADTLRVLKKRFPNVRFIWLMGADNLKQIPRWQKWREIFNLVPVAVFRRPGYPAGRGLGKAAIKYDEAWVQPEKARKLGENNGNALPIWTILDNKLNYTSSTRLRKDNPSWHS